MRQRPGGDTDTQRHGDEETRRRGDAEPHTGKTMTQRCRDAKTQRGTQTLTVMKHPPSTLPCIRAPSPPSRKQGPALSSPRRCCGMPVYLRPCAPCSVLCNTLVCPALRSLRAALMCRARAPCSLPRAVLPHPNPNPNQYPYPCSAIAALLCLLALAWLAATFTCCLSGHGRVWFPASAPWSGKRRR